MSRKRRRQLVNYDRVVRDPKTGNLSYESVRTVASRPELAPAPQLNDPAPTEPLENPANSNLLPNKLPETPSAPENGNLIGNLFGHPGAEAAAADSPQADLPEALATPIAAAAPQPEALPAAGISCHEAANSGNQLGGGTTGEGDAMEELLARAVAAARVRRGRPAALDENSKGQLVALLSVGMSLRQAASVLGVSHTTVQKSLKADPSLSEQITAARFQAQLQPLACVIREARRSWKAATWLLKYLDGKLAAHEETPDERRAREQREHDEFFTRAHQRSKTIRQNSR